ncbi:MAG: LLM class flavin-dependent oxidoreductase [Acidimicrobiia bacterium]
MSGLRVAVGQPGAGAEAVVELARVAERWNIDAVWVGDPDGGAGNADDTYVLVTAAAVAAATSDVRIGTFLTARASAPILRLAEDIGVVDRIAGGRLEIAFVPPAVDDDGWEAGVTSLLGAWRRWPLPDGRTVCVTPSPAQPVLPVSIVERAEGRGHRLVGRPLSGGHHVVVRAPEPDASPGSLVGLRRRLEEWGSAGVLVLLPPGGAEEVEDRVGVLGGIVAPCLRAPEQEVEILALDARRWREELVDLHQAPE